MRASDVEELSAALRAGGRTLSAAGLSPGTTGNMSFRTADRVFVTRTGGSLGEVGDLSELSLDGDFVSGPKPTKEVFMHVPIYQSNSALGAVVHLHSTYATLCSALHGLDSTDAIPAITPYLTMKAGKVGVVPYVRPGSPALANPIQEFVRQGGRAILLANHGSLVAAETMEDAVTLAFEIEEAAKLHVLSQGLAVHALTAAQVSELRR